MENRIFLNIYTNNNNIFSKKPSYPNNKLILNKLNNNNTNNINK